MAEEFSEKQKAPSSGGTGKRLPVTGGTGKAAPIVPGTGKKDPMTGSDRRNPIVGTGKKDPMTGSGRKDPIAGTAKYTTTAMRRIIEQRNMPAWKRMLKKVGFYAVIPVIIVVFILGVKFLGGLVLPQPGQGTVTDDFLRTDALKVLDRAKEAEKAGNYEEAETIYASFPEAYRDYPDLQVEASKRHEDLKIRIARERSAAAQNALEEANKFYAEHPELAEDALKLYKPITEKWGETPAAALARTRIPEIEKYLAERDVEAVNKEYDVVKTDTSKMVAERNYDGAIAKLKDFSAAHTGTPTAAAADEEITRLEKDVETSFASVKKEALSRAGEKHYGLSLGALDHFIKTYVSAAYTAEALALKRKIEAEALDAFRKACEEPDKQAATLRLEDAVVAYRILQPQYDGTQWGPFIVKRIDGLQAQIELHAEVISRIKAAARQGNPVRLPFELITAPKKRFVMMDADEKQLFLENETPPKFRQPMAWTDFSADQLYAIYCAYLTNPTPAQHNQLGCFCEERSLTDKAEVHFGKAKQ